MSRTEKKADFITIGIYTVLAGAALYTSAALGACVDLATDSNGRLDFEQLTESLDTTLTDTRLVFSQVQAGGNAAKFPVFAAFGIGIYVLMKITGKKRFHRRGEEHGSAKWAGKREIRSLADRPQKKKKGNRKARDQPDKAGHRKPSAILKELFSYIRQIPCQLKRIPVRVRSWFRRIPGRLKSAVRRIPGLLKSGIKRIPGLVKSLFRRKPKEFVRDNNIILTNEVKMSLNTRHTRKNLNVMVIGGSGSGKSRFFVKPNMMQANTSYVCTDPKGELLRSCGKMLEHYGYRIKVFNLIDMAHSHNYNPFHYIYDADGNYSATAVIKMINVLMKNTQKEGGGGGDQFWEDSTRALLAALCFYLVECEDESNRNFAEVMRLLKLAEVKEDSEDFQSDLDLIFDALEHPEVYTKTAEPTEKMQALNLIDLAKKAKSASRYMCLKYYKDFKKAAGDTAKSILISTAVRLQAFNIPEVMDLTCCDNLHLEMTGDEKTALFIIIPSSDDTFNFLAAMMYTQLFDVLYDRANFKHGGRLPIHVRCLLDEFANLGQIPRFEELLATMRSMEISANVIIQNLSQLKKMYKDSWENVLGNCDSLLFLGGQEPTTLEHISKTLGKETIDTRSQNRTRGRNGSTSENDGILGRELMTVDELKVMKDNECILFVRGIYPFFCSKYVIEKHPNYALLEDSNKANAFLLSDIQTVQFSVTEDAEEAELHTEPVEDGETADTAEAHTFQSEAAPEQDDEAEQSVTLEEIQSIGIQPHSYIAGKQIPKSQAGGGSEPARLDENDTIITAKPELKPPFTEVSEISYLDGFDDF